MKLCRTGPLSNAETLRFYTESVDAEMSRAFAGDDEWSTLDSDGG